MPIQNITIDTSKPRGAKLYQIVSDLERLQDELRQLKEEMDNQTDGANWTQIESVFGVPTGMGEAVYNLTAGSVSELSADTNFAQLCDRITTTG